jgi:hypothetical protein
VDVTNASLALHTYMPANLHVWVRSALAPHPFAWAASEASRAELDHDMRENGAAVPGEWIYPGVEPALSEVARQWAANEALFHFLDGRVETRIRREPRGRLIETVHLDGTATETLWVGPRSVERTLRDAAGKILWSSQWPVPDATGAENEACRLEARLVLDAEGRRMLDFAPDSTGRPRCASWLSILAGASNVFGVDLSRPDATDADVEAVLDVCPSLESLLLDETKVTSRSLARIGEALHLRHLALDGCKVSVRKVRALLKLRPELQVSGVWL